MSTEVIAPSVVPDLNFNVQRDCDTLRKAIKTASPLVPGSASVSVEDILIDVLCRRSWLQRHEIKRTYDANGEGVKLELQIASVTRKDPHFCRLLQRLLKTPAELGAFELHHAIINQPSADEECLVEFICAKSNEELRATELKYIEMFEKSLEHDISLDTHGYFRRLLISLLSCQRPREMAPDLNAAAEDAEKLHDAFDRKHVIGATTSDKIVLTDILCNRSYTQLRAIFDAFQRNFKTDITNVIKSDFKGDVADALLAVVGSIRNRPAYFANRLHAALNGTIAVPDGTREDVILRIVASRCDFDLNAIKAEYEHIYDKQLSKAVQDETTGHFQKALVTLIGDC